MMEVQVIMELGERYDGGMMEIGGREWREV